MMTKEYIERNARGYEGDTFIHDQIIKLCDNWAVDYIFETGTYLGATTKRLASIRPTYTFEVNPNSYQKARHNLEGYNNIIMDMGNSPELMDYHLDTIKSGKNFLFFLDAHWETSWPILAELKVIASKKMFSPVIVIHDFVVPGTDFGFDTYHGQKLDIEYIKPGLDEIYGPGKYTYYYNSQADGAKRGVIYIHAAI